MYRHNATLCIKKKNIYYMSKKKEKSWLTKICLIIESISAFEFIFEVASAAEMGQNLMILWALWAFRSEVFC